jgi:AmmeMemoRadiSam system protein A
MSSSDASAGPREQGREAAAQRGEAERSAGPREQGREAAAQRGEAERSAGPRQDPPSLRAVAHEAIEHGLAFGRPPRIDLERYPAAWADPRASFVTLHRAGELRGCTGTLEARDPLVVGVAHNAWRSAFADPRFPPLGRHELDALEISVSLLSAPEPLPARSRQELLATLRPGRDGLVLREGARCATFLPAVWETLPEPADFLDALARKAGLAAGHWSATLRFERYGTEPAD